MLNISRALKNPGQSYPIEVVLPDETIEVMGDEITLAGVCFYGVLFGAGEEINVNGKISALAKTQCANCLIPIEKKVTAEMDAVFVVGGDGEDAYPITGYEIDLEPVIRENVILELPIRFLCKENCKGLCPKCGCDLNVERCSCDTREIDPRWAALSSFFEEDNLNDHT